MKKLLLIMLSFIISFSLVDFFALAKKEKVEISFLIGESTLIINEKPVTVEKPYVVGDGVTLVPVRVITESFGADVLWDGETKKVTLDFEGTNIILHIGSSTATINGEKKELLAAPELTENGFTMVPLRFISENFGASVDYDKETKRVIVTRLPQLAPVWNVSDGKCSCEAFGISFSIPSGFALTKDGGNEIFLESTKGDKSLIEVNIYSKENVTSDLIFGNSVISENSFRYNKSVVLSDSAVSSIKFNGFNGYGYFGEVDAIHLKGAFENLFFENGDYVINIGIFCDFDFGADFISGLSESIALESPATNLVYERKAPTQPQTVTMRELPRCVFSLPEGFTAIDKENIKLRFKDEFRSDRLVVYADETMTFHARRVVFEDISVINRGEIEYGRRDGKIIFEDVQTYMANPAIYTNSNISYLQDMHTVQFGDNKYLKIVLENEGASYINYHEIYATEFKDAMYIFYASFPEIHYSMDNRSRLLSIMQSIQWNED